MEIKHDNFAIINVHGVGFKVFASSRTLGDISGEVDIFTHLNVKEETLIGVPGVGPETALGILSVAPIDTLNRAIASGELSYLTKVSGIGRKTAERIIVELRGKVGMVSSEVAVRAMESDADVLEALLALGYKRDVARSALEKIEAGIKGVETRLKAALKILGKKNN